MKEEQWVYAEGVPLYDYGKCNLHGLAFLRENARSALKDYSRGEVSIQVFFLCLDKYHKVAKLFADKYGKKFKG